MKAITWKEYYLILPRTDDLKRTYGQSESVFYDCVIDYQLAAAKCFRFPIKKVDKSKFASAYGIVCIITVGLKELLVVTCRELCFYMRYLKRRPS